MDRSMEEQWAQQLLRAAAASREVASPVEALTPTLKPIISKELESWRTSLPALEDRDVIQAVLIRLLTKPPTKLDARASAQADGRRALVTVLAWVKTVTKRYLTDEYRKARELATEDETLTHLEGQRGAIIHGRSSTEGQVRAALELRWLLRTLNRDYPQGARLVEAMRHDPDSTPTELAESMGTSVANVYQIRTRVRNLVSDLEGRARRKEQVR